MNDFGGVKFFIGDVSDDDDDEIMPVMKQQKRKRQKSEGSSGVSTQVSATMSNANSSFASSFSDDYSISDEELYHPVNKFDKSECVDPLLSDAAAYLRSFNSTLISNGLEVDQSNVVSFSSGNFSSISHQHEMSYLSVHPAPTMEIVWRYFVCGDLLVFHIPTNSSSGCVQDALITLLEYGESDLRCSHAAVLIEKRKSDKVSFERLFSFMGFRSVGMRNLRPCLHNFDDDYVLMVTDFSDLEENDSDAE